jgi:hypothetical protein
MSGYNLDEIGRAAGATSAALEELRDPALEWSQGKTDGLKKWEAAHRRARIEQEMPEDWVGAVVSQLLAGAVFGDPVQAARFLRDRGPGLTPAARDVTLRAAEAPWRYTVFSRREQIRGDIHLCIDHDSNAEFLLVSRSVSDLDREGVGLYMSLLLDNGTCRQAFGPVHPLRGYQPYDFAAFSEALEPQLYAAKGVSATMSRHAESFALLAMYGSVPAVGYEGTPLVLCADWHAAREMPPVSRAETLEARTQGQVTRLALAAPAGVPQFAHHAHIYYDAGKRMALARAVGTVRYAELVDAAGPAWGFSALPRWKATLNATGAMERVLHKEAPGSVYLDRFEDGEEGAPSPELKKLNALVEDLIRRLNAGMTYSVDELADLHGVERQAAREAEASMQAALRRRGIDPEAGPRGGLPGFTPPPPDARQRMNSTLERSDLFVIDVSEDVGMELVDAARRAAEERPLRGRRGEIRRMIVEGRLTASGLARFVEEESLRAFGLRDVTVLNYVLYLLLRAGGEPRPVAQYANEVARVYGQIVARNTYLDPREWLTGMLARYGRKVLEPAGLLTLHEPLTPGSDRQKDAALLIETTPLFRRWIRLSRYWE